MLSSEFLPRCRNFFAHKFFKNPRRVDIPLRCFDMHTYYCTKLCENYRNTLYTCACDTIDASRCMEEDSLLGSFMLRHVGVNQGY